MSNYYYILCKQSDLIKKKKKKKIQGTDYLRITKWSGTFSSCKLNVTVHFPWLFWGDCFPDFFRCLLKFNVSVEDI